MIVGHAAKVSDVGALRFRDVQIRGAIGKGRCGSHGHVVVDPLPLDMLLGQRFALDTAREHGILAGIHYNVLRHGFDGGAICRRFIG